MRGALKIHRYNRLAMLFGDLLHLRIPEERSCELPEIGDTKDCMRSNECAL